VVQQAKGQLRGRNARQRGLVVLHQAILVAARAALALSQRQRHGVRDNDCARALRHVQRGIPAGIVRVRGEQQHVAGRQAQGAQHGIHARSGILHKGAGARGRAQQLGRQGVCGARHGRLPLLCAPHEAVRVGLHGQHGRARSSHHGQGGSAIGGVVEVRVRKVQRKVAARGAAKAVLRSQGKGKGGRGGGWRCRGPRPRVRGAQAQED
jgi:hypothetical protein